MVCAMRIAAASSAGRRSLNEDVIFVGDRLIVLADGMGGHPGGSQAAQVAVGAAVQRLVARSEGSIMDAFKLAHGSVREYRMLNPAHSSAGCTLTIASIRDTPDERTEAVIGYLGDTSAFLVRAGAMTLVTPPHTLAESLRAAGELTEAGVLTHPGRHVLEQYVGAPTAPQPDVTKVTLQAGDRLLVCSDGLLDVANQQFISAIANGDNDAGTAVDELVARAVAESRDNVTVAIACSRAVSGAQISSGRAD